VASFRILDQIRILNLEGEFGIVGDDVLNAVVYSSLISAPRDRTGWHRPEYVFSRFVSDCAKFGGFDGIRYGSTRSGRGHNLVLLNPTKAPAQYQIECVLSYDGNLLTRVVSYI
jgi:hypothetical protein